MKTHAFFGLMLLYLSYLNTFIYVKGLIPKERVRALSFSVWYTNFSEAIYFLFSS